MPPAREAEALHQVLEDYNWDDGLALLAQMARSSGCDLALALELFYLADGAAWLDALREGRPPDGPEDWRALLSTLYDGISSGRYLRSGRPYALPLNRTQRVRYAKAGVPPVFLEGA